MHGLKGKAFFNCFREENKGGEAVAPYIKNFPYKDINPEVEKRILSDFNCQVIHTAPEYQTNLQFNTPTNRIITSMCSIERLYNNNCINDNLANHSAMVA